jgi:23S rRNA pseudouridine1911/1915/1917 synthase
MTDSSQDPISLHRFTCTSTPLVEQAEFPSWILHEDDDVLAMNKPGWLVCHPSKAGPMSSLIGAAKEYCGKERLHLVSRLDRETSGIVLIAKTHRAASQYQQAIEARRVAKTYLVWLMGRLTDSIDVDQPLARDLESLVHVKQTVRKSNSSQKAQTRFEPLHYNAEKDITLARSIPHTGRKHQIRAHAKWMGFPVYGDKLYGPDDLCYLTFIEKGWTDELASILEFPRQALHASSLHFQDIQMRTDFHAPLPADLVALNCSLGFPVAL